ncbi:MAG: hypothetical protein N2D54_01835, partial [Chloroflexota bacterium]
MIILLPIVLLLVFAIAIIILNRYRTNFTYHWLAAVGGVVLAWLSVWVMRAQIPQEIKLIDW